MSADIDSDVAAPADTDQGSGQADYLGSAALEQMTGIPASTWRYWVLTGTGPKSFKIGRRRVWKRSEVVAWLAAQEAATGTGLA
jgi:prophage regulatory protein